MRATLAAEHWDKHDAIVVAAFGDQASTPCAKRSTSGDPLGRGGADERLPARRRFSIVAISPRITAWYRECVRANRLIERLASIRSLDRPVQDIGRVQEEHLERLLALCIAVDDDGADVIVAGAPLAGAVDPGRIPVPVVDGVSSAVCHAQTLVSLAPTPRAAAASRTAGQAESGPVRGHRAPPRARRRIRRGNALANRLPLARSFLGTTANLHVAVLPLPYAIQGFTSLISAVRTTRLR
jgi:Asp/Glu/hydantoin racemase